VSVLRRYGDGIGLAETLAQAFVIGEKETPIFDDRSTAGGAELISFERRGRSDFRTRLSRVKEIPRVEFAVPDESYAEP